MIPRPSRIPITLDYIYKVVCNTEDSLRGSLYVKSLGVFELQGLSASKPADKQERPHSQAVHTCQPKLLTVNKRNRLCGCLARQRQAD